MREISFKYIPLSFISSKDEIKRQVNNTIIMKYVLEKYKNPLKLSDLLEETRYGYTDSAKASGSHKFLRITDINEGRVNWDNVPFCNCENAENYLLRANDILVARTGGTTGKSFIIKELQYPSVFASYLIRMRVSSKLNPDYLYIFLNSYAYWNQIVNMKMGSAQPNVNAEKLKELLIPYCDLETQNKIVNMSKDDLKNDWDRDAELDRLKSFIDEVNRKIDLIEELKLTHDQNIDLAKKIRLSILQEAIQGKLTSQDSSDEPPSVLLERIKEEKEILIREGKIKKEKPLPPVPEEEIPYELPQGWQWVRLKELTANIHYGYTASAVTDNTGIKFLRITDIQDNKVNWDTVPYCEIEEKKVHLYLLKNDDILIARTGSVGKSFIVKNIKHKVVFASYLIRIIPLSNINPDYLKLFLETPLYWDQLLQKSKGSVQLNVNAVSLSNLLLPLPPLDEQKRIVEIVDQLMVLCAKLERKIEQSQKDTDLLLQSVLQEAFAEA